MRRTTVVLPEALLRAAKRLAAEQGRPLRELIEAGVQAEVSTPGRRRAVRPIRWVTVDGGIPGGVNVASRPALYRRLGRLP